MPICDFCGDEGTIIYFDEDNNKKYLCKDSAKKVLDRNVGMMYKGIIYHGGNPNVTRCRACSDLVHVEQAAVQGGYCLSCKAKREFMRDSSGKYNTNSGYLYCTSCGGIHKKGMCPLTLSDTVDRRKSLSFMVSNESKDWKYKGEAITKDSFIKTIGQFQIERELGEDEQNLLNNFYCNSRKFSHYYTWEPVNIEGEVQYYNYELLTKVISKLNIIREDSAPDIVNAMKVSKYYNYYLKGLDDSGLLKWQYIDIMGNIREKSESINKFFIDSGMDADNSNMYCKFKYKLSADLSHKVEAFKLNERVASCQKSSNYDSYARGAYDAITNGCNCPILIYTTSNKLIARITTRIMYDEQGQEYILIDRIYHSGEFSDKMMKGEIYKAIVKDLKTKGHKVIASPYSAHDKSTFAYLSSLGMQHIGTVKDLCQPLRRLVRANGYYCDGGTDVIQGTIDGIERATDYLDKAYLF